MAALTSRMSFMYLGSSASSSMKRSKNCTNSLLIFWALMVVPQTKVSFS